jgi:membrane protein
MSLFWRRFYAGLRRIAPGCITQSQAIAFNMFLTLFPMMLLLLGVVAQSARLRAAFLVTVQHLGSVLPPGAPQVLAQFLNRRGFDGWRWISYGLVGTLLAGTQMMRLTIEGLRMVHRDPRRTGFWSLNLRALLLLSATIAPWLLTASLIVFGKELRAWMILRYGVPVFVRALWSALYVGVALTIAAIVLTVVYRVGRPVAGTWRSVMPGAVLATVLWWGISSGFGVYMRHMPYGAAYGGLAAAIGMMLWMQLTVTIVLFGAAFNAERLAAT